ncbi:30S ribosomal protein S20 [Thermodesulfobacterium sp. TA1]|uniref:30S ribosomal protein S20 n=1 Tax=Thermodesulfobacterium sp. TA1 TaxID=2234087 RepID=UPI001232C3CF|nr:30S ribosomal protein S20 [Thermodesulfobacterium sp. TA1]QER42055.1 30S ribosomal protein S20 [Thermodesulfobacterium sp. TA1]
MPHHKSAKKALRQSEKRRLRNKAFKSRVKTEIKKFLNYLNSKELEKAESQLRGVQSLIHKGVSKGIFHWKKAANKISKLFKKFESAKIKATTH